MMTKLHLCGVIALFLSSLCMAGDDSVPSDPGYIGFRFTPHRASADGSSWLMVRMVREGTPAEKAGLRGGDLITHVNGKLIQFNDGLDILLLLAELKPDKPGTLTVKRDAKDMMIEIIASKMTDAQLELWRSNVARFMADRVARRQHENQHRQKKQAAPP